MPIGNCPNCEKGVDIDGYGEHGFPTLFYCECGKIFKMGERFMVLIEVPTEEVDLSGIENWPIPKNYYSSEHMSRGLFIKKSRWEKENKTCLKSPH